jgi:hypothetical protein
VGYVPDEPYALPLLYSSILIVAVEPGSMYQTVTGPWYGDVFGLLGL